MAPTSTAMPASTVTEAAIMIAAAIWFSTVWTGMLAAPNLGQDYGRRFNGLFQNVAEQCGATLYPFFLEGVFTKDALMLPDDVHPNSSGIRRVVSNIEPVVARELSS